MSSTIPKSWQKFYEQSREKGLTDKEARDQIQGYINGTIKPSLLTRLKIAVRKDVRDYRYSSEDEMEETIPELVQQSLPDYPEDLETLVEENPELSGTDNFDEDNLLEMTLSDVIRDNLFFFLEEVAWAEYKLSKFTPRSSRKKTPARYKPLPIKGKS